MRSFLFACMLLFGAASASAQSGTTFQLPPDPETTSRPQAQGPTDTEGENRTAPRVIGTPTPTPRAEPTAQPSPRASATPTAAPTPRAESTPTRSQTLPATDRPVETREVLRQPESPAVGADTPAQLPTDPALEPESSETIEDDSLSGPFTLPQAEATSAPAASENAETSSAMDLLFDWAWLIALVAALMALLAVVFAMRGRRKAAPATIQPPVAAPRAPQRPAISPGATPASDPTPPAALAQAEALEVETHAVSLSRSVMNASVSYQITLINRGRQPITDIRLNGELTTAHGRVPATQQLADPNQAFPQLHAIAQLDPGERTTLRGELRLPLREVRALRQGNVPVFVPLVRLTVGVADQEPRAFTYVIGSKSSQKGARPNPFRLDEQPRSYAELTTRAVA